MSSSYGHCGEINYFLTIIMFGITKHKGYNGIPVLDDHLLASYFVNFLSFCGEIEKAHYEDEGNEALWKSMQRS